MFPQLFLFLKFFNECMNGSLLLVNLISKRIEALKVMTNKNKICDVTNENPFESCLFSDIMD